MGRLMEERGCDKKAVLSKNRQKKACKEDRVIKRKKS